MNISRGPINLNDSCNFIVTFMLDKSNVQIKMAIQYVGMSVCAQLLIQLTIPALLPLNSETGNNAHTKEHSLGNC